MKHLIVGNNVFASMLYDYLSSEDENVIEAFTVEASFINEELHDGLKVVPFETIENVYNPRDYSLYLGVGYSEMNDVKEHLFNIYHDKGYKFETYAHPSAILPSDMDMGEGNIFFEGVIIQRGCSIGKGNVFFARTLIGHDCSIGDFNSFSFASVAGNVTIKDKCFMGMGSVIGEELIIDDRVFVGANAFVNESLLSGRVVLGEKGKLVDRDISERIM